jgi:translation initiation factor 4B
MKPDPSPAPPVQPVQVAKSPALSNRELSTPPSPAAPPAAPASRPKLNLAKRTISEAPTEAASTPASDSKASPFGAARPIDTATREKEVEEKRQIAIREKKEADEKARAEKKAADDKAKEEKRLARDAELAARGDQDAEKKEKPNGQSKEKANGQSKEKAKENGAPAAAPGKSYEILRRATHDDTTAPDDEADEAGENGLITEDKAVKPKEIVRDISPKKDDAAQTNGASATGTPDPTADTLEDEGWSTVSKPVRSRKSGNQAARAIAS